MSKFAHLHLHTQYSVLDGAIKLKNLIQKVKSLGQSAVGMTDHGNMHGAIEFYQSAIQEGVKPIIGCEVYLTPGARLVKSSDGSGPPALHHLTLLAKDMTGYRNLCRLVTVGYLEGFYFKPRIDHQVLKECNEGIICLSGCVSSELASFSTEGRFEDARRIAEKYAAVFGDRFFLEVQPHAIKEQRMHNEVVKSLGQSMGLPLVATNDCHYLSPDDHHAQEVLMCISMGKLMSDQDRIRHEHARLHLKTESEMYEEMPEFAEAIAQTMEIANSCELEFDFKKYFMPKFDPPPGQTIEEQFVAKTREGLSLRLEGFAGQGSPVSEATQTIYRDRLELEIKLILEMGFAGYFLVVSDFILWAKNQDIPVGPGRGSAAGSLVAYVLFITEIDPIPNKLLFERFLNPERVSLPDIDVDFCIFGRDKVIEYVCDKYGRDKVAQIVTFGTLKAKAAIKDVGRVLGLSYAETDRIAKLIPAPRQGFDYPIAEALKMEKRLREYADGEGKELIELAMKLEGLSRHTSTHAAGIVIADRPVVEFMPLMLDKDGQIVTQYSMSWVEKIGLLKFDFLGLKTLSVLHEAKRLIQQAFELKGEKKVLDLNSLPLDDARTYKLISAGRTIGVFQLESSGITEMVSRLKPNCFEDLVAILALYRPGPLDAGMVEHYINRKHGREPVRYLHPLLESILKDTYGIILYQEQIMQIAQVLGGYSLAQADMLRRAMGKKKPEEMAEQRSTFLSGAIAKGVPEKIATEVFDQMETFARYGFNRSHSVAYALISYQTGYLKAHYPSQFMAALMTFEMGDTDRTLKNLNECRELGIAILPPDINRGEVGFSVVGRKIVFGLAAIKGVGEKVVERIIEERKSSGPFKGVYDCCLRLDSSVMTRRTTESFIKAGAFDETKAPRSELLDHLDEMLKAAQRERDRGSSQQMGLFDTGQKISTDDFFIGKKDLREWPSNVRLSREREVLGFYLSGHPLERFRKDFERLGLHTIERVRELPDASTVTLAGVISFLKLKNTKKGDRYATFTLEDLLGTIEVIVWPDTYQQVQEILASEDPVILQARLDVSDERRVLVAQTLESAIAIRDRRATEAVLQIDSGRCSPELLERLKVLLSRHRGECRVRLIVRRAEHSETVLTLPDDLKVAPSEALCNSVEQLFGEPVLSFR